MLRILKHFIGGTILHDLAAVHDFHGIGITGHNAQIVGDNNQCGTELLAELIELLQHLRLYGNVQSRGGLVTNQNVGIAAHTHGNHGALLHTAGELERIVLQAHFRIGDIHHGQQLGGLCPRTLLHGHALILLPFLFRQILILHTTVGEDVLSDLITDGENGV